MLQEKEKEYQNIIQKSFQWNIVSRMHGMERKVMLLLYDSKKTGIHSISAKIVFLQIK